MSNKYFGSTTVSTVACMFLFKHGGLEQTNQKGC